MAAFASCSNWSKKYWYRKNLISKGIGFGIEIFWYRNYFLVLSLTGFKLKFQHNFYLGGLCKLFALVRSVHSIVLLHLKKLNKIFICPIKRLYNSRPSSSFKLLQNIQHKYRCYTWIKVFSSVIQFVQGQIALSYLRLIN